MTAVRRFTMADVKRAMHIASIYATKGCSAAKRGAFRFECDPRDTETCAACREVDKIRERSNKP